MSAQDQTEKVLRQLHVLLSKSEPYPKEPSKVIVDKEQMLALLADLNTCMYGIMDEYELTQRSRDRAEREFRKQGDQIVWDASRKAEDIYAASVMYTDEALNRVWDIMDNTSQQVEALYTEMAERLKKQQRAIKTDQLELKSQLQDLVDTEKYLSLIEQRNREIKKQKEEGKEKPKTAVSEKSIYANRQSEIKVNTEYLEKLGYALEEEADAEKKTELASNSIEKAADIEKKDAVSMTAEEKKAQEEKLKADLDADYFEWVENEGVNNSSKNDKGEKGHSGNKEVNELTEGIQKMWKSITSSKTK